MATHTLTLEFDDASKAIRIEHRCHMDVAGHKTSHAEAIELTDTAGLLGTLQAILDANRGEMEARAELLGIEHAAALAGKVKRGQKSLRIEGRVGATGTTELNKG